MQLSELAARASTPVATVKYYLREGLLPAGRRITARLSDYDDQHLRRLRLLRILREVGDVPIERLRDLVAATEHSRGSRHAMLAEAADALAPRVPAGRAPGRPARRLARELVETAGWTRLRRRSPQQEALASTLETIVSLGTHEGDRRALDTYARLADELGRFDVDNLDADRGRVELLEEMVVGEVVFGELFLVLRRLAHEHYSDLRFGRRRGQG